MTGCSSAPATAGAGATCGSTHTAAGVPVIIKVAKGSVNCKTAMQVENEYAAKIKAGQVTRQRRWRAGRGERLDVSGIQHPGGAEHGERLAMPHRQRHHPRRPAGADPNGRLNPLNPQELAARRNRLGPSEACPAATAPLMPREVLLTALRPLVVLIIWTWSRPPPLAR